MKYFPRMLTIFSKRKNPMMETAATKPVREDPNCVVVIYNVTIIETGNGKYKRSLLAQ